MITQTKMPPMNQLYSRKNGARYFKVGRNGEIFVNVNRFGDLFIRVNIYPRKTKTFPFTEQGHAAAAKYLKAEVIANDPT